VCVQVFAPEIGLLIYVVEDFDILFSKALCNALGFVPLFTGK